MAGSLSLLVSLHILVKRPKTPALKFLFLFGIFVSLWEVSAFLCTIAPDFFTAITFHIMLFFTSQFSFPIYLLTVLNVREKRNTRFTFFVLIPAIIMIVLFREYLKGIDIHPSEFGWSYRVIGNTPLFYVYGFCLMIYVVGIFVVLLDLRRKTKQPLLKRKYTILLLIYTLFQTGGTFLTNMMIAYGLLTPNYRAGGILHFLTFLSIWYVLSIKEKEFPSSPIESKDFSQIYSSFLTVYYNSTIGSSLGEEVFQFMDFVRKSKIENHVLLDKDGIIFKETEDLDLVELIKRNLEFFDKNSVDRKVVDRYLRVLNAADKKFGWSFEAVVNENEDFLKKSDLLYGISEGKFLEKIAKDESLRELDDIDACLKIYRRILYPFIGEILKVKTEFREKLSEYYVTEGIEITDFGEISINDVKDRLMKLPESQRLSHTIEAFNSVLSWVYERLLKEGMIDVEDLLRKLRLVLRLNKDKAVELGVYPSLLGRLATKIPQREIHKVYSDYLEELVEEKTRELKKAHENLLKSQRLAAIGEVAAMVGHDLRNPLQAIVYSLHLAKKELESSPNSSLTETIRMIEEQVEYMNKIVSDLQYYASPIKPNIVITDLKEIIGEILSTIRIPEKIEVSIDIEDSFKAFPTDPILMKRVLTNLIMNAIQAIKDKGQLRITAYTKENDALISVQDTGIGIPEENLSKIFQPFFTTKAKGQGLGLAVCKRIIETLQGSIMLNSKVGKGTTFTIKLPFKNPDQPQRSQPPLIKQSSRS